jgi:hypothetical protein
VEEWLEREIGLKVNVKKAFKIKKDKIMLAKIESWEQKKYYRGHPKVNVFFFYCLIFTLNHRRPKMSKFDTSDKKFIETIFFKCHISLRCRQG